MNNTVLYCHIGTVSRIVVKNLSHLTRSVLLIHELFNLFRKHNVEIVSVADGIIDLAETTKFSDVPQQYTYRQVDSDFLKSKRGA